MPVDVTSRRSFLRSTGLATAAFCSRAAEQGETVPPLQEFDYRDVQLAPGLAQTQFEQTQSVLLGLNEDSLLKPWRLRAGLPAPGQGVRRAARSEEHTSELQ